MEMMWRRLAAYLALVMLLAVSLTACAAKVRVSSQKMCEAHGGSWSAQAKTCSYTQSTKSAAAICQAHGGWYQAALDYCEIE